MFNANTHQPSNTQRLLRLDILQIEDLHGKQRGGRHTALSPLYKFRGEKPVSKTFYAPSAAEIVDPRLNSILANRSQCLFLHNQGQPLVFGVDDGPDSRSGQPR